MNEQALQDAYNLFVQTGYNGDINKFMNLMSTNPEALQDAHNLFVQTGYNGDINKFKTLIGVGQQQPTVQPIQQQPTVKKKDDMEWDWFGGDGSSELEPSKTERPTTVAEASQTWKKAEAPKPMFMPDYTKPIEEEKFTLTRPTELGFVGRATPEQLKEQVPEFLKTSINAVTNDLLNKGADSAKKELDYYFKDAGFDFMPVKRQGFEDIIVRSPNGQELMVSLGAYNIGNATKEIKQFIEENSTYIPNLKKVEKQYLEDSKKILNIKQVDDEMKSLNEKAESLRKDMNLYLEDSAKLKQLEDKLSSYPEKLKNTQEYKTLVEEYSAMAEDNKATYDFLEQSRQAIVSYENTLKKAAGDYTKMKESQGTFLGAMWNKTQTGLGKIASGLYNLSIDYLYLQKELFLPVVGDNYVDYMAKAMKYGEVEGKDVFGFNPTESMRNFFVDNFGTATTSKEYTEKIEREGNIFQRGLLGLAESSPAMIGNSYMRLLNMYALTTDYISKEMEDDPDFKNMSEMEKLMIKAPIGVVGAALEEMGFRNLIRGTSIIKNLTGRVISRLPAGATAAQVRYAAINEIKDLGIKGTLALTGSALAEAETGLLQQVNEYAVKDIYNAMKGKDMFDTPDFLSKKYFLDLADASATEAVGGLVLGVPNAISTAFQKDGFQALDDATFKIFEDLAKDNDSRKFFVTSLKNKINLGEITPNQGKQMLDAYDQALGMIGMVPDEITDPESRKIAMDLLSERKRLETKKQGKDDALAKPIQNKIDQINEQLTKLTEDAIQKQAAGQVSVQPETGAGQEVEVGGTEAKPKITPEESKRKEDLIAALEATDKDIITIGDEMLDRKEAQADLEAITQKEQALVTEQVGMEQAPAQVIPDERKINIDEKRQKENNKIEDIIYNDNGDFEGSFLDNYEFVSQGSESTVYRSKDGSHVIKISEPYNSKDEDLYKARITNNLLREIIGNSGLEVIGYYEKNGVKNPVYRQDYIEGKALSEKEVGNYLGTINGVVEINGKFYYKHEGKIYLISDFTDNVIQDKNGKIVPIDLDISEVKDAIISAKYDSEISKKPSTTQETFEQRKSEIEKITDPEQRKVAEIEFIMSNLASGVGEASANKIREYADRIISGKETREQVIQGLPKSFVDGIDQLLSIQQTPAETRTPEQEADLLEELLTGKKKEPVVAETVTPTAEPVVTETVTEVAPVVKEVAPKRTPSFYQKSPSFEGIWYNNESSTNVEYDSFVEFYENTDGTLDYLPITDLNKLDRALELARSYLLPMMIFKTEKRVSTITANDIKQGLESGRYKLIPGKAVRKGGGIIVTQKAELVEEALGKPEVKAEEVAEIDIEIKDTQATPEEVQQQIEAPAAVKEKEIPKAEEVQTTEEVGSDRYKANSKTHVTGRQRERTIADGTKIKGRYKLVSADDVLASHNEENFGKTEGFPVNEQGKTVNDRDYETDKAAQSEVIRIAGKLDERALSQTPIVTKDGIVVDGNNRTMSRKLAAKQGTDQAYLEALRQDADMYGIDPNEIDNVKNPMLIFEADQKIPYTTKEFGRFNKAEKKEKSPIEKAVELSKTITDRARRILGGIYERAEKPSDVTSNAKNMSDVRDLLLAEGILQPNELPRYINPETGTATKEGVAFLETLLIGSALNESVIRTLDSEGMGAAKMRVMESVVQITQNSALGENSLQSNIENGIKLLNKATQKGISVVDTILQMELFETAEYSAEDLAVAILLDGKGFKAFLNKYNSEVGTEGFFGSITKEGLIDELLNNKIKGYEQIRENLRPDAKAGQTEVQKGDGGVKPESEGKQGATTKEEGVITEKPKTKKSNKTNTAETKKADKEKPAISNTVPTSEKTSSTAASLGGVAYELPGGIAIIQVFNLFGQPIYIGYKNGTYTRIDIDSFDNKNNVFTEKELNDLKNLKKEIENQENKNQSDSKNPFTEQGRVAATDSVPNNIKQFVENLTKALGINKKIFIITDNDFNEGQYKKHGLFGTLAAIRSAILGAKNPFEFGSKRYMSDADAYYIYYDGKLKGSELFSVVSHEIGHIIEQELFKNASKETVEAIKNDYNNWVAKLTGKTLTEVQNETRDITIQHLLQGNVSMFDPSVHKYISSFSEYLADNVAKWARTSQKPKTLVDKFFSNLVNEFKKIRDYVFKTGNYSENIFKWLDELYDVKAEEKVANPALANVEATAKALEKVDKDKTEGLSNIIGETLNKRKAKINTETNSAITNKGKQIKFRISRSTDTEIDQDFLTITAIDNNGNKVGYAKFLDNGNKNLEGSEVEVPSKYQKQGIASAIYSYADALGYNVKESVLQTPEGRALWKSLKTKQGDLKSISEAYHKAKADGSNPELVQAVEEALGKPEVKAEPTSKDTKSLADAVRRNLKIKGPDGLQSNILGILPAIWNAGVETMAKAIEAGVAINEAVQKAIEYIREKHGKKFNEAAAEKKLLIGHYKGAIEIAREAKVTNEGLKTYLKRQGLTDAQIEPLLKIKERAEKKPISKEKAIDKPKRKKVTVDEMAALKDQIRLEARAAREAKGDLNAKRKMLAAAINDLAKKGKISVRQAKAIVNRISSVNLDNPVMVDRLLDYAEKVFNDADYDTRIQEVRKLQDKVKRVNHVSMIDTVREFASINPERIPADRLLDYIQALDDMSTRTPFYQKMNDMFDEVMSYKSESKEFDAIKTFQALIDKLESIAINQVKSVEDYVALIRDINSFKRKAYQLLQNGAITQEQYDKAIENIGKDQAAVEKKYEKELAALKEKLVQEINGLKPEVHPDFTPEEAALINKYLELSDDDLASLSPEDLYILNDLLNNIKEDAQLDYYRLSEIVSKAYTNAGGQKLAKQLNESKFNKSSDEGKKLLLEYESAFWEGLLGLGRAVSGALQKFIVSPFNRAIASYENAMKDGYYEFSKLKRKYKMKDYNMHRLGIFTTYLQEYMAQFDPANKDVKDIGTRDWFGEIISNSSMRDGYRSAKPSAKRLVGLGDTELKTIEKIYKSLPKDANGKVDPKAVYDSFMANDGKFFTKKEKAFFDKVMDWKQKNLTTKQKAANEMNGMPFKEIPFHMMRVRLDRGAKQISPTAEGGSGVVRIEAGTGKERASQKVGPIMTNFEQLFTENLEQTARNYYLQEAINDINNTLSVAKKNLKENKEGLFNTIPKTISDALNFEFDKTESQFLARNLLAARAAETLLSPIRTAVELTSTLLSYPFRAKTPQGYKELFGKQGQMKKLLDFTSSPLRLRENINKAIDISDGRIKPKGKFEKALNYLSGLPERTMMVTSWMPTFNNEFKDITGVRFDMDKFNSDAAYRQKYGKAIKEAAAVADAQTEKIIGSTTKAGGRREIRIAPKILANIFGAEGTIKKNTTAGQILGFFSNYPYREATEFLNGFREAAEVYKQGGGAIKSISQLQKPLGVTINLATYGFLSSVVYAMKLMLLGDDEDEEKGEGMLKELMTFKGFMEELQGNAISLGASKYAAGGKAMLQLGATVAYNSTSDEEWKAKIKKLLKNSVFVEPIAAEKVQAYGGRNEVLGAISSYVPQFVLFAKRIEETIQTAGELKVMYKKFQDGGIDALSEDEGLAILAIDGLFKSAQAVLNLRGTSLPMYNDIKMYMKGIKKEAGVGDIKLSGTENQHKKALQGYKNEKEFKENDPDGYLEAIDEGGSIYKYKEEQSKKEEEKNKDKPFRGMSEEAFKKKYREEYIENYGPGTEYYEEQRTPEAIEKRAEMRALQKEENAIKAKNKKKRNEEDTEE